MWEHFQWSEQEQAQEQEGENETLKIKKAPFREGLKDNDCGMGLIIDDEK